MLEEGGRDTVGETQVEGKGYRQVGMVVGHQATINTYLNCYCWMLMSLDTGHHTQEHDEAAPLVLLLHHGISKDES